MAVVLRFPSYHPCSYYNRVPRGYDFFQDLWREIALPYEQHAGNYSCQQAKEKSHPGSVNIASVPLSHYKPEEIPVEVDNENVTLHGQHRLEKEDGFEQSEFKRFIKIPEGVDPKAVKSRTSQDGGALVIEGVKRAEEKRDDGKFEAKLDFKGFKPEEINVQLNGKELTITGKHVSERDDFHVTLLCCRLRGPLTSPWKQAKQRRKPTRSQNRQ